VRREEGSPRLWDRLLGKEKRKDESDKDRTELCQKERTEEKVSFVRTINLSFQICQNLDVVSTSSLFQEREGERERGREEKKSRRRRQ